LENNIAPNLAGNPDPTWTQSNYTYHQTDKGESPAPESLEAAREKFSELWVTFPRNPTSSEDQGRAAYLGLTPEDRDRVLEAAKSYRAWFVADSQSRKRSFEQGSSYAPHLWRWISSGDWKRVPVSAPLHRFAPSALELADVEYVDRVLQEPLFKTCERLRGRRTPELIQRYAFPKELVRKARGEMRGADSRPSLRLVPNHDPEKAEPCPS
jgi:hypothetical protein